jgi:hypothetical protein
MTSSADNLVEWATDLYALMYVESKVNDYGERVFEGKVTDLFKHLDVGIGNYTPIRQVLVESGAIVFQQRGNRMQPSVIELRGAEKISAEPLTRARRAAIVKLQDVDRRLAAVENWRETTGGINLGEALRSMELRLTRLEELATNGRNEVSPQNERK